MKVHSKFNFFLIVILYCLKVIFILKIQCYQVNLNLDYIAQPNSSILSVQFNNKNPQIFINSNLSAYSAIQNWDVSKTNPLLKSSFNISLNSTQCTGTFINYDNLIGCYSQLKNYYQLFNLTSKNFVRQKLYNVSDYYVKIIPLPNNKTIYQTKNNKVYIIQNQDYTTKITLADYSTIDMLYLTISVSPSMDLILIYGCQSGRPCIFRYKNYTTGFQIHTNQVYFSQTSLKQLISFDWNYIGNVYYILKYYGNGGGYYVCRSQYFDSTFLSCIRYDTAQIIPKSLKYISYINKLFVYSNNISFNATGTNYTQLNSFVMIDPDNFNSISPPTLLYSKFLINSLKYFLNQSMFFFAQVGRYRIQIKFHNRCLPGQLFNLTLSSCVNSTNSTQQNNNTNNATDNYGQYYYIIIQIEIKEEILQKLMQVSLNNTFIKTMNQIPGVRYFSKSFLALLINFDDLWLYNYNLRNSDRIINYTFSQIRNLQQSKWTLFNLNMLWTDINNFFSSSNKIFMGFKQLYSEKRYYQLEGKSSQLFINMQNIIFPTQILITLIFLGIRIINLILIKYKIKLLKPLTLLPNFLIMSLQGNIQFFSYLIASQLKFFFTVNFEHKLISIFTIIFFIFLIIYSIILYFFVRQNYGINANIFFQNVKNSKKGVLYLTYHKNVKNIILGFFHCIISQRVSNNQLFILFILQILFLYQIVKFLFQKKYIIVKSIVVIYVISWLIRLKLIILFYFQQNFFNLFTYYKKQHLINICEIISLNFFILYFILAFISLFVQILILLNQIKSYLKIKLFKNILKKLKILQNINKKNRQINKNDKTQQDNLKKQMEKNIDIYQIKIQKQISKNKRSNNFKKIKVIQISKFINKQKRKSIMNQIEDNYLNQKKNTNKQMQLQFIQKIISKINNKIK